MVPKRHRVVPDGHGGGAHGVSLGRACFDWMDELVAWAKDGYELPCKPEETLARFVRPGLLIAAHEAVL